MHFMTISGSGLYLFGQLVVGENSPASVSFFSHGSDAGDPREREPGLPPWPGRLTKSDFIVDSILRFVFSHPTYPPSLPGGGCGKCNPNPYSKPQGDYTSLS